MRMILVALLLMIGSVAQAQDIHGVIMNLLGQPIKGAVVSVSGAKEHANSGETGEFTLTYSEDQLAFGFVILRHPLYSDLRISLQEFQGTSGRLSVMLDPKRKNCRHVIQ